MAIYRQIAMTVAMLAVSFCVHSQSIEEDNSDVDLPDYVLLLGDGHEVPPGELSDSLFYSIAKGVVFPVNKFELNPDEPFLKEFHEKVAGRIRERGLVLAGIDLRGAASPEGPYEHNVMLAEKRTQAIFDFLKSELDDAISEVLQVNSTPEDYNRLLMLMRQAGDKDAERVGEQVATHAADVKSLKTALQKMDGGRLWQRMLRTYFPQLRSAKMVMYFKKGNRFVDVSQFTGLVEPQVDMTDFPGYVPVSLWPDTRPAPTDEIERRHVLSVSTNLLYDGFYLPNYGWAPSPNIELEYYPKNNDNWTFLAALTFPYYHRWAKHKFYQIRDYHLEARYYFAPLHTGWFAAAYVNNNIYGIGFSKTKGWEGEGLGAAVKGGYVWKLCNSGRWRLELSAAFGGYLTRFDPYIFGNPITGTEDGLYYYDYHGHTKDFKERNHQRVWFGPTEFGLKLRYDLLYRRVQKKGVSFKRKEVRE